MSDFEKQVDDVVLGLIDALPIYAELKEEKKRIDELLATIEPIAQEEAEQYIDKKFEFKGWVFEKRSGGSQFNFSNIPAWSEKKKELADIELKAKAAYSSYSHGLMTADENGEEVMLPEVTNRKDSIIIKKSK